MKLWNNINWPAAKVGHTLKLKMADDFWRGWSEQNALQEKVEAASMTSTDRTAVHALMVWSDDGGAPV